MLPVVGVCIVPASRSRKGPGFAGACGRGPEGVAKAPIFCWSCESPPWEGPVDLEALRARIAEILERLAGEGINALTNEELSATQDELLDLFNAAREFSGADGLAEASKCRDGILQIKEVRAARAEEEARIAAEFDKLAEDVTDPEPEVVEDPEPEPEVAADEPDPEPVEEEQASDPAVVDVVADPAVPVVAPAPVPVPVPAAAAAQSSPARARASRGASLASVAAANRPAAIPATPRDRPLTAKFTLNEDGKVVPKNRRECAEALARSHERWARAAMGVAANIPVIHGEWEYPEERNLTPIASAPDAVTRRFDEVMGPQALTAAGGICAPFPVDYSLLNIATDERPVASALPSFQTPRGGIQFMPSYTLADVGVGTTAGNAIAQITRAQDLAGTPTKPCATFTCKSVTSCEVYAVTRCVQFGNWNARFYPELIDNVMSQVMAVQARYAEELLLSAICTGSTKVDFNGVQYAGALPSLLAAVGRAAARLRGANRAYGSTIRVAFPSWVRDLVREDLSIRLANSNDQFALADTVWNGWLAQRGVSPWYFIDGQNDIQELAAAQTQGPLVAWPTNVVFYVYFEGAWTFLDGGTLDLGIVRDSTLNAGNNFQMFAETFEGICNRGLPSLCVNARICANGGSAGTYPPEPCAS